VTSRRLRRRCGQCFLVGGEAWRPPRRSFELFAKPSVLVRSGGELPRSDWDWRHHRLPTPFPQNGFRAVDDGDRTSGRIQSGRGTVP